MSEQPTPEEAVAQAEAVVESAASAPAKDETATEARRSNTPTRHGKSHLRH